MKFFEKRRRKKLFIIQEKCRIFHRHYCICLNSALEYGAMHLRGRTKAIENLFAHDKKTDNEKEREFRTPISYKDFLYFKKTGNTAIHHYNKEFKSALSNISKIHNKQRYRNIEVLKMMVERLEIYEKELKRNRSLNALCKISKIKKESIRFRNNRINEAKNFIAELKKTLDNVQRMAFMNELKNYLSLYDDFFVITLKKLDAFRDEIHSKIIIQKEELDRKIIARESQGESLRLPSWDLMRSQHQ